MEKYCHIKLIAIDIQQQQITWVYITNIDISINNFPIWYNYKLLNFYKLIKYTDTFMIFVCKYISK